MLSIKTEQQRHAPSVITDLPSGGILLRGPDLEFEVRLPTFPAKVYSRPENYDHDKEEQEEDIYVPDPEIWRKVIVSRSWTINHNKKHNVMEGVHKIVC